jgi:PAS domain S-box-containing protein
MQDKESLSERIIQELLEVNKWYLILFGIISAEIITALSVLIISSMFYPEMQGILLRIGVFVSFIASLLAGGALVYLSTEIKQARLSNVDLKDDIAKRKRMEEALREGEEKYKSIFENVHDMIIFVDTRGNLIDANSRVEAVIGYKREDLVGRNFLKLKLFKAKDLPKITKAFFDSVKSGKVFEADDRLQNVMELRLKHKDGHIIHVETSTAIIKKEGKVQGFLSVIRDVTTRKQAENEMKLLQEINTAMNAGMVLDDLLQVAADGMKDIFEFSSAGIYLLDKDANELVFKTQIGSAGPAHCVGGSNRHRRCVG